MTTATEEVCIHNPRIHTVTCTHNTYRPCEHLRTFIPHVPDTHTYSTTTTELIHTALMNYRAACASLMIEGGCIVAETSESL